VLPSAREAFMSRELVADTPSPNTSTPRGASRPPRTGSTRVCCSSTRNPRRARSSSFTQHLRRGPTASLTRNDSPSTARRARIGEEKFYKDAQNTPEGGQK
jgi:hypothetical protein